MDHTLTYPTLTYPLTPSSDRLLVAICIAVAFHLALIFGIGFELEDPPRPLQTLEVILVQKHSEPEPEKVDYLAQANLLGGGDSEARERPTVPLSSPFPEQQPELASSPALTSIPTPQQRLQDAVQTNVAPPPPVERPKKDHSIASMEGLEVPETKTAAEPVSRRFSRPAAEKTAQSTTVLPTERVEQADSPSAASLMSNAFAIASLNAEIAQRLETKAHRPRKKFISATTREYRYAAYMEAWRSKVERVGNLNYPQEARRKQITGSLVLDVALKPSGSVQNISVRRSSGYSILDQAAIRIVRLAAPFAPFPPDIRRDVDILNITRTWQFTQRFSSR